MQQEGQTLGVSPEHDTRHRYRCNECRRAFTVTSHSSYEGGVRCPGCLGDDVTYRLSRCDRLMRFLMLYEAACGLGAGMR